MSVLDDIIYAYRDKHNNRDDVFLDDKWKLSDYDFYENTYEKQLKKNPFEETKINSGSDKINLYIKYKNDKKIPFVVYNNDERKEILIKFYFEDFTNIFKENFEVIFDKEDDVVKIFSKLNKLETYNNKKEDNDLNDLIFSKNIPLKTRKSFIKDKKLMFFSIEPSLDIFEENLFEYKFKEVESSFDGFKSVLKIKIFYTKEPYKQYEKIEIK